MSKGHSARAWYAGRTPPSDDVLSIFDKAGKPEVLYDQASESNEGEFATLIRGVYSKMDTLKRSPDDFRTWAEEDGYVAVYEAVLEFAAPEMKARVGMLQQLGTFKFRGTAGPEDKRKLISAVYEKQLENEDPNMFIASRARRLAQIWAPKSDSLLDFIVARPAQTGRVLSDRLNPTNPKPFRLIGHPFKKFAFPGSATHRRRPSRSL